MAPVCYVLYTISMVADSCMYAANISFLFIKVWAAGESLVPEGCIYTADIGFISDVYNAGVCYMPDGCVR